MPDVVGSARRTLELFDLLRHDYAGLPRALVAQDGIQSENVPWEHISAIFIGGTDSFKDGPHAMAVAKAAKILGKWVHVGRVNGVSRIKHWMNIADSCDGSGLAKYDHMFNEAVDALCDWHPVQMNLGLC